MKKRRRNRSVCACCFCLHVSFLLRFLRIVIPFFEFDSVDHVRVFVHNNISNGTCKKTCTGSFESETEVGSPTVGFSHGGHEALAMDITKREREFLELDSFENVFPLLQSYLLRHTMSLYVRFSSQNECTKTASTLLEELRSNSPTSRTEFVLLPTR